MAREQAGYSGTPLARKLGIKGDHAVLLSGAPPGFSVPGLPAGVEVHRRHRDRTYDVVLAFCPDRATLLERFQPLTAHLEPDSALWVCWPKRSSGVVSDLDENVVRDHGLEIGLVDVKVCAVDEVWSGLKFVYRLADRPRPSTSSTQA